MWRQWSQQWQVKGCFLFLSFLVVLLSQLLHMASSSHGDRGNNPVNTTAVAFGDEELRQTLAEPCYCYGLWWLWYSKQKRLGTNLAGIRTEPLSLFSLSLSLSRFVSVCLSPHFAISSWMTGLSRLLVLRRIVSFPQPPAIGYPWKLPGSMRRMRTLRHVCNAQIAYNSSIKLYIPCQYLSMISLWMSAISGWRWTCQEQSWNSWEDALCGRCGATKILPADSKNIEVPKLRLPKSPKPKRSYQIIRFALMPFLS